MDTRAPRFVLIVAIVMSCAAAGTGGAQNTQGRIESFYFDSGNYTEVWLDLTPPPRPGEPVAAVRLNFTVRYKGKPVEDSLTGPPLAVIVRAQASDLYNPAFIRQPILTMYADGEQLWDPTLAVNFYSSGGNVCDTCSTLANTVDVRIPVDVLERMGSALKVTGNALGFEFELEPGQIDAVRRLTHHVFGKRP
jgi:hypothetical protein